MVKLFEAFNIPLQIGLGLVTGLIPFVLGIIKKRYKTAIKALFVCLIMPFIIWPSSIVPVWPWFAYVAAFIISAIFVISIFRKNDN